MKKYGLLKKFDRADLCFLIFVFIGAILFAWKAQFGLGDYDEAFYLTIPKRIMQGDALIAEEWHVSQLFSVLLLPIFAIYSLFNPSLQGAILHFRYIYVMVRAVAAVFLYWRLKRVQKTGAFIGCSIFYFFGFSGTLALSYNTVGHMTFFASTLLLATSNKKLFLNGFFAGVLFSCAVLCSPYLAVVFAVYVAAYIIKIAFSKRLEKRGYNLENCYMLSKKMFLGAFAGVALMAALFFAFVLLRCSISDIIDAIPGILSDPEHPQISLYYRAISCITEFTNHNKFNWLVLIFVATVLIVTAVDKKRRIPQYVYFLLSTIVAIIWTTEFALGGGFSVNGLMIPLNVLGVTAFILLKEKPHSLFYGVWVPTLMYAVSVSVTSNIMMYSLSGVLSIGTAVSAVFVVLLIKEMKATDKVVTFNFCRACAGALVLSVFLPVVFFGITNVTWDKGITQMNSPIKEGVSKGTIVSQAKFDDYTEAINDAKEIMSIKSGKVLYITGAPYFYLEDQKENACYSAWVSIWFGKTVFMDSVLERLNLYYENNPEKWPDYIYIDPNFKDYLEQIKMELKLSAKEEETPNGGYIIYT